MSRSPDVAAEVLTTPARTWPHLLAGASGGLATSILTSTLDVLRTRFQSDLYHPTFKRPLHPGSTNNTAGQGFLTASSRHVRETAQTIGYIYKSEGWRGFFRGLGPSLLGVVPAAAIKFYVYGTCKHLGVRMLSYTEDSPVVHAQAAIMAGIAVATCTNPIWLIKTRLQLDVLRTDAAGVTTRRYKNSLDCVRQVVRQEGISGLYRGLSASYLGTVETALHLVLYEQFKLLYHRTLAGTTGGMPTDTRWSELHSWIGTSGAAGCSKLAAVLITYPHEVLRARLRQVPRENGVPKYHGLSQSFRLILAEEGWAGLYGGLTPHLMRSIPSSIITLGVYEFVLRFIG